MCSDLVELYSLCINSCIMYANNYIRMIIIQHVSYNNVQGFSRMVIKQHVNRGSEINNVIFKFTLPEVTTYPSLPDPASVVPKPEVQHAVPGRNSWSKAGRQAGWTWSGSHKKKNTYRVGPIRLLVRQRPRLRLKAELSDSRNISTVGTVLCF